MNYIQYIQYIQCIQYIQYIQYAQHIIPTLLYKFNDFQGEKCIALETCAVIFSTTIA